MNHKSTKLELVEELYNALQEIPKTEALRCEMISNMMVLALSGHYHDTESPLPAPKAALISQLQAVSLDALADRVMNGEFDEI